MYNIFRLSILAIMLIFIYKTVAQTPKLQEGVCIYNKQYNQTKKITEVRTFVYEYCIYKNGKCKGNYTVRQDWFNFQHTLTKCPE